MVPICPFSRISTLLLAIIPAASSSAIASHTFSVKTVFQLDQDGAYFKDLVSLESGKLIATRADVPEVWEIDPDTRSGVRLTTIPGTLAVAGITKVNENVVAFSAGNSSSTTKDIGAQTWGVWTLDFTGPTPVLKRAVSIPEAYYLNGMESLDDEHVLVADSIGGAVFKVNVYTGAHRIALIDPTMTPLDSSNVSEDLGIVAIKKHGNSLYFTNRSRQQFSRIPISRFGTSAGSARVLASGFTQDGFAIDNTKIAYVASGQSNTLLSITPNGAVKAVAGDDGPLVVSGGISCGFGGTWKDKTTLYVTTHSYLNLPENGSTIGPGKVVALDYGP